MIRVMRMFTKRLAIGACALSLLATACSPPGTRGSMPAAAQSNFVPQESAVTGFTLSKYVKHVVFIVQENRSFENLFAGFHGADAPMYGYAKQPNGQEKKITLKPIDFYAPTIYHGIEWVFTAYDNGKMDQFNKVPFDAPPGQASGSASYAYLKTSLIQPYRQMAYDYTLADHMFPTAWGGSFSAHLDLIAGTSVLSSSEAATVPTQSPWGCDAPNGTQTQILTPQHQWSSPSGPVPYGPFPCFDQFTTMASTLDHAKVSWKYYAPSIQENFAGRVWSEFRAIKSVY